MHDLRHASVAVDQQQIARARRERVFADVDAIAASGVFDAQLPAERSVVDEIPVLLDAMHEFDFAQRAETGIVTAVAIRPPA